MNIEQIASTVRENLLPVKSKNRYKEIYNIYRAWRIKNELAYTTEDTLLAYFSTKLSNYKSSSLWSIFSMLKATIQLNESVDISNFPNLHLFIKRKNEGHKPKKSSSFSKENVDNFIRCADNSIHLLSKVSKFNFLIHKYMQFLYFIRLC